MKRDGQVGQAMSATIHPAGGAPPYGPGIVHFSAAFPRSTIDLFHDVNLYGRADEEVVAKGIEFPI